MDAVARLQAAWLALRAAKLAYHSEIDRVNRAHGPCEGPLGPDLIQGQADFHDVFERTQARVEAQLLELAGQAFSPAAGEPGPLPEEVRQAMRSQFAWGRCFTPEAAWKWLEGYLGDRGYTSVMSMGVGQAAGDGPVYLREQNQYLAEARGFPSVKAAVGEYEAAARQLYNLGQAHEASLHFATSRDELQEYPDILLSLGEDGGAIITPV